MASHRPTVKTFKNPGIFQPECSCNWSGVVTVGSIAFAKRQLRDHVLEFQSRVQLLEVV